MGTLILLFNVAELVSIAGELSLLRWGVPVLDQRHLARLTALLLCFFSSRRRKMVSIIERSNLVDLRSQLITNFISFLASPYYPS